MTEALKSVFVIVLGIVLVGIACPPLWVFPLTLFEIRSDKPVVERELSVEEEALSTERDWRRQRERAAREVARERAWLEFEEWERWNDAEPGLGPPA